MDSIKIIEQVTTTAGGMVKTYGVCINGVPEAWFTDLNEAYLFIGGLDGKYKL
jgi:hypothetical protein